MKFFINALCIVLFFMILAVCENSCIKPPEMPAVITEDVTEITQTTATSGGEVTNDGGAEITSRGVCWATIQNPTISDQKTNDGNGRGSFSSSLTGLTAGTNYYVRAYATNEVGTAYGEQKSFSTDDIYRATLSTDDISSPTQTGAVSGGNVTDDGGGTVSARGVCWSTTGNPTNGDDKTEDGQGIGSYTSNITGLEPSTTYYVRAYAINEAGTAYGEQKTFNTLDVEVPILTTAAISAITQTGAVSGGEITSDGGASITARGVCWSTEQNPTVGDNKTEDGTGSGSFTSSITGLSPETTYYVRAYASNSAGTAYGNQEDFTTEPMTSGINFNPDLIYGTVTDIDGNVYRTIAIGAKNGGVAKVYLAENLRVYNFNDGTNIPMVSDNTEWSNLATPGKCVFNNTLNYAGVYGFLYNWYAVNSGKLCPTGWHVATNQEWTELTDYLGGLDVAGGKLKEKGTSHWVSPNTGATNESGFTAMPGSIRYGHNGQYAPIMGGNGSYWTSTAVTSEEDMAHARVFLYNDAGVGIPYTDKKAGLSVRCIKDE